MGLPVSFEDRTIFFSLIFANLGFNLVAIFVDTLPANFKAFPVPQKIK